VTHTTTIKLLLVVLRKENIGVMSKVLFLLPLTQDYFIKMRADAYRGIRNPRGSHSGIISVTPHQLENVKINEYVTNNKQGSRESILII
jgi:hypothetical protein